MYDQKKEEVNIDIIDAVETGMNNVMSEVQNDFQENKLQIKNVKTHINDLTKNNISSIERNLGNFENLIKIQKINELNQLKKNIEKNK